MLKRSKVLAAYIVVGLLLYACQNEQTSQAGPKKQDQSKDQNSPAQPEPVAPRERKSPLDSGYTVAKAKAWWKENRSDSVKTRIVLAVNRTDSANFKRMDSVLIPKDLTGDLEYYLPFPFTVPALDSVNKILIFSYPAQAFAAYEHGELVYTGPTNMGRKNDPTPTGLYFTNWKSEKTTSTFNDEWELKWNFNIENKEGIGFHQYALPGYPASHSCLRLQEKDAVYLYSWADQWVLKGTDNVLAKGTPVIVFGTYNFAGKKPWWQLTADPKALNISVSQLEQMTALYKDEILREQLKRQNISR